MSSEDQQDSKKPSELIEATKDYIKELLKNEASDQLLFHNFAHLRDVAEAVRELGTEAGVAEADLEALELAAWFHDIGYIEGKADHESRSVKIASKFLEEKGYPAERMNLVNSLILSTDITKEPQNQLEELLHDADISHLGKKRFFGRGELLRAELEAMENENFTELDWQRKQYNFLIKHPFLTIQAQQAFGKRRVKNIKKQRDNIVSAKKVTRRLQTGKDFGRGIDTLYRSTYRNHINFSSIADGKANMMISINTILISVIVTLSGASFSLLQDFKLESYRFTIPILILMLGSLVSVFFAVMSARPKVTEKDVSKKKVKKRRVSLLFFGNFLEISQEEFTNHLSELKNNQQELYDSMSMDIYNLGVVLKEKYRLLSISYTAFISGITLCVVGYLIIFLATNL